MSNRVFLKKTDDYDPDVILRAIEEAFSSLGLSKEDFEGKKVVIKPNLVMKKAPEGAATTHPSVINAICRLMNGYGVRPVIAESPGGVYSASRLAGFYRVCGIEDAASGLADLNTDTSSVAVSYKNGEVLHSFNLIKPIVEADVIIDAGKLKSHSLTKQTGAVKNLFGTVPGIEKFEMHARFSDEELFSKAIADICSFLCENKKVIAITDAIVCMEGNGPTGGRPKKVGYLIVSDNPAAADAAASYIIGFDKIKIDEEAQKRGMYNGFENIVFSGDEPKRVKGFAAPDSKKRGSVFWLSVLSGKKIGKYFTPRPVINAKKCVGCGECVRSCPKHTIRIDNIKGKPRAVINSANCIRCFCCQELCPHTAIKTARNPIVTIADSIKR